MWAHVLSVAYEAPPPRDVAALRTFVDRMPALELQRRLVGYYVRWFRHATPADVMEAAVRGDRAAMKAFLGSSYPEDRRWQDALRARLEAGATQAKRDLVAVLAEWEDRVFDPHLSASMRPLSAAAAALKRSVRAGDAAAVSRALNWEYVPEPGISRVLILPSLVIRPEVHEFEHEQLKFLCVPAQAPAAGARESGADLLELARAMADETRLRIVLTLAEGDLAAQELADRSGAGLTTVLHHLAVLQRSGLISGGGRRQPYRLSRERIGQVGRRLVEVSETGTAAIGRAR
jgi:DNA-binding transcriptional ArsR family regulator